ncbi:MAG: 16S rRNA (uracil(1498)-N(3))-methyltransferase [Phycisphaerales bacterium]|nr:16S rRNA (uracil(1498)-N(3))-methyltransferase [Phycisphaerales bacterium]
MIGLRAGGLKGARPGPSENEDNALRSGRLFRLYRREPTLHRIHYPDLPTQPGAAIVITGEEAHHAARVKRAGPGEPVQLLDGRGAVADASITGVIKARSGEWSLHVAITAIRREEPLSPRLEVWASSPKGPRLESMIDGLCQAGAAAWAPLHTTRTVVDPREGKLDRMHRLAAEASKQSGRAWHLEVLEGGDLAAALAIPGAIFADASGAPYHATGRPLVRLLIGPEGGWTPEELSAARAAGAQIASFGPHIMRIETAAVIASGIVLDQELRFRGGERPS